MRDKYLLRFINTWSPPEYNIPVEVFYSEACHQRDLFREKVRAYNLNNRDKRCLPKLKAREYVFPIMCNLRERTNIDFPMFDEGTFRHPQPAYLVLAAWHFLLSSDPKINKFWEKNFKDDIMSYLQVCSSVEGICDSLRQHIHDYDSAIQPVTLFDVPIAETNQVVQLLPNYVPHISGGKTPTQVTHNYFAGSVHDDHSKNVIIKANE